MNKLIISIMTLLLFACSSGEEEQVQETNERLEEAIEEVAEESPEEVEEKVEEEPEPEEGEYGSDRRFDNLYDNCEDGDGAACDELFWDSPLGSEYEEFAMSQRSAGVTEQEPEVGEDTEDTIITFALEAAWQEMQNDPSRDDFCVMVASDEGAAMTYEYFMSGWREGDDSGVIREPTLEEFTEFFRGTCQ